MPCEPGKHAACLPGSQGIFLYIQGRPEIRSPFPEQFHVFQQRKVIEKENQADANSEFSERMSQVASTGIPGRCGGQQCISSGSPLAGIEEDY